MNGLILTLTKYFKTKTELSYFSKQKFSVFFYLYLLTSIVGLYSTFIILIAQFVRELLVDSQSKIIFEELPNVDKLMQLLEDILLVRSFCLLELENELYDKLIYIHRDPKLMIHLTQEAHKPRAPAPATKKTKKITFK